MPQDPGYGYAPNDGYNGGDPEDPNKGFTFDDASIRRGFIRKVYSILMVSNASVLVGVILSELDEISAVFEFLLKLIERQHEFNYDPLSCRFNWV